MGRIYLCFLRINQAGQWWSMRKQSLRQSVIERIWGVAEFQGRNTDDMIFYGWSINYVTSQFHPDVKIMNFHWQRIIETHQCTRRWSFRSTSNMHGSRSEDYINLEVMKPCFCISSCLKENVPIACNDAVSADIFLVLFSSDDVSLSVTWSPRVAKISLLTVQGVGLSVYLSWWQVGSGN